MKTKLKHILNVKPNKDEGLGKITKYMIWSPVHHSWLHLGDWSYNGLSKREKKFLLKQEVIHLGLRNDTKDTIAIFLKDYGKDKNKKLYKKLKGAK